MLVQTITFEIHNFNTHVSEMFVVENTEENYKKVLTHRYTRNIEFKSMQDFQFAREMRIPTEFISMDVWIRLLDAKPYLFEMVMMTNCNCESLECGHGQKGEPCMNSADVDKKIMFVGSVCSPCFNKYESSIVDDYDDRHRIGAIMAEMAAI